MVKNEKVFVVTESELEELVANRQTEALKTIYNIAKEYPEASWNELILKSAQEIKEPGTHLHTGEPAAPAFVEPVIEEHEPELVEEEEVVEEDIFAVVEEEPEAVTEALDILDEEEDEALEEEEVEEEEDLFDDTLKPSTSSTRVSPFRSDTNRVIREASIFDD